MSRFFALLWAGAFAVGCGGDPAPTYHQDVAPILAGRCVGCHEAGGIGTFPLDTYADVKKVGEIVASVTETREMPPWKAASGHMDYANDPSLTDEQIATIGAWVDAGMPEGDADAPGEAVPSLAVTLPRVDRTLAMPEPFSPTTDPDDYRCFVLDWQGTDMEYVTGFDVHPGNDSIVHHVAAFLVRPDGLVGPGAVDLFREWDARDELVGYSCFGGPSLTGESLDLPVQQVAQWVPGAGATLFPPGVGIPIPAGSIVVLQLHYNTLSSDGLPDSSSIDLMIDSDVDRIGAFAPWLDAAWTFGQMDIPAHSEVSHVMEGDPLGFFQLVLGDDIDLSNGFDIHAAMLHMHTLGASAVTRLDRADGSEQVMVEVPDWDFNWQLTYQFSEPLAFAPGDGLYVKCTFDNTGDNDVNWGEGSVEEMCVSNLFVSAPK